MIRSMTGFGEAQEQIDGIQYLVELRSVNNKYFKSMIRLPDEIMGLEADLESALRKRITRGSVTLTAKIHMPDSTAAHRVNHASLLTYMGHLETIHKQVATREQAIHIDLTSLLALPGVLIPAEDEDALLRRARPILLNLTKKAYERLVSMRIEEGKIVARDLALQRQTILDRVVIIRDRAPRVIEQYHQRLRSRIDELLARAELKVDEHDLIREVAIFSERSDISEEITRLVGHLDQMQQTIDSPDVEPAGRTLDFLAQELLREANTVASKANDAETSRAIVEAKGAIDRIKEQAQNIE